MHQQILVDGDGSAVRGPLQQQQQPDPRILDPPLARPARPLSCIVTLHGMILDLTGWQDNHPGGSDLLQRFHGRDATQAFERAGHSDAARSLLVGFMADDEKLPTTPHPPVAVSQPAKWFLVLSILAWFHQRQPTTVVMTATSNNNQNQYKNYPALTPAEGQQSSKGGSSWPKASTSSKNSSPWTSPRPSPAYTTTGGKNVAERNVGETGESNDVASSFALQWIQNNDDDERWRN